MTPAAYKSERVKRGLSQAALAALVGVSRGCINYREAGHPRYPITLEASLAMSALPISKNPRRPKKRTNAEMSETSSGEAGGGFAAEPLLGRCVEAGDDDAGQPMMLIHTTRDALKAQVRNVLFEDVVVIRADELDSAEVGAFDGQARTITLRFDLMPCAAIGERWLVRPNTKGL